MITPSSVTRVFVVLYLKCVAGENFNNFNNNYLDPRPAAYSNQFNPQTQVTRQPTHLENNYVAQNDFNYQQQATGENFGAVNGNFIDSIPRVPPLNQNAAAPPTIDDAPFPPYLRPPPPPPPLPPPPPGVEQQPGYDNGLTQQTRSTIVESIRNIIASMLQGYRGNPDGPPPVPDRGIAPTPPVLYFGYNYGFPDANELKYPDLSSPEFSLGVALRNFVVAVVDTFHLLFKGELPPRGPPPTVPPPDGNPFPPPGLGFPPPAIPPTGGNQYSPPGSGFPPPPPIQPTGGNQYSPPGSGFPPPPTGGNQYSPPGSGFPPPPTGGNQYPQPGSGFPPPPPIQPTGEHSYSSPVLGLAIQQNGNRFFSPGQVNPNNMPFPDGNKFSPSHLGLPHPQNDNQFPSLRSGFPTPPNNQFPPTSSSNSQYLQSPPPTYESNSNQLSPGSRFAEPPSSFPLNENKLYKVDAPQQSSYNQPGVRKNDVGISRQDIARFISGLITSMSSAPLNTRDNLAAPNGDKQAAPHYNRFNFEDNKNTLTRKQDNVGALMSNTIHDIGVVSSFNAGQSGATANSNTAADERDHGYKYDVPQGRRLSYRQKDQNNMREYSIGRDNTYGSQNRYYMNIAPQTHSVGPQNSDSIHQPQRHYAHNYSGYR